jgi:hypothetical protein
MYFFNKYAFFKKKNCTRLGERLDDHQTKKFASVHCKIVNALFASVRSVCLLTSVLCTNDLICGVVCDV